MYCGGNICVLCLWSRLAFRLLLAPVEIGFIRQFVLNANQNPNIALKNGAIMGNISLGLDDTAQQYFLDRLQEFIISSH